MARNKLKHFGEMKGMERVFEPRRGAIFDGKGRWREDVFMEVQTGKTQTRSHLIVELACGRGDYTVALAERFPDRNFVGIDVKGARMWHGCKTMLERGLNNAAFLRIRVENLMDYFGEGEIDEIWLTFPDPQPGKENKRLTAPRFLELYRKVLKPGGFLHLKHDDVDFFEYSLESARQCGFEAVEVVRDVHSAPKNQEDGFPSIIIEIQTTYEKRHLAEGRRIYYARFQGGKDTTLRSVSGARTSAPLN